MKKLFMAVIAFMMTISASAQFYIYCSNGNVIKVDSISMIAPDEPVNNGHEYVDLGLSVKWATCNVGASKPEEYGDYFAWGETQPKDYYDWSTYKWCNGSYDTLTKYNTNSSDGTVDNKTTLDLSDDAARANWGGSWRMPTSAEQDELCNNCTWTCTKINGVEVYKVTSNINGNFIFLPSQAIAAIATSSMQVATATTGRVRSTRTTRTARMNCPSAQTTLAGAAKVVVMDYPCDQYALRIYPFHGQDLQ